MSGKKNRSQGTTPGPWLILGCSLLIAAAVFGGYRLSQAFGAGDSGLNKHKTGDLYSSESEQSSGNVETNRILEKDANRDDNDNQGNPVGDALNMTPVGIVYEVNSETGRIECIFIEVLRCLTGKLDLIRIAPEVSYTMTGELYRELTVDNTELPQTVTLSELYRYYHSERAYSAGMKIISELLNFNIRYYTAIEDIVFTEFVYVDETSAGPNMGFVLSAETVASDLFGTRGSFKGAVAACLDGAVTNFPISERLRYLEVYDALTDEDVTFTDAPVREHNESRLLDDAGTAAILYNILY